MKEPPIFKVQFPNWSDAYSKKAWVSKDMLKQLEQEHLHQQKAAAEEAKEQNLFAGFNDPVKNKMSYAELKGVFPPGIKPDKKELYLDEKEFEEVFKMKMADYLKLKLWKQQDLKKKVGLF